MKKGLVVLLILVMAGAAFAQEVKVSGAVKAGLNISQQGDDDAIVKPYNDAASYFAGSDKALRTDLTVRAAYDNYGAQVRLRSDNMAAPTLHHAFVWGEFLNDIIKVSGGKIATGDPWATDGDWGFGFGGVSGIRFEFKPIAGLNFGFALDAGSAFDAAGDPKLTLGQFFKETVLGVKYTSDLFNAVLAFKLDSDAVTEDGGSDDYTKLAFGINIKAVPGLTAIVEGQLTQLGVEDNGGVGQGAHFDIYEYLGYQISDPFEVHLNFVQLGNFGEAEDTEIYIKPGVSFEVLPSVFLKGDLDFGIYTVEDSALQIGITPGVEYKFSDNASIAGWYTATINKDFVKDADLHNSIQFDFNWSF